MNYYTDNIPVLAWQGTCADGTTQHLKVKETIGIKIVLKGDIVLCVNALHGSIHAVDMLRFSEGLWVKRTLHEGIVLHRSDKIGSSERIVVAEADATQVVVDWAFWCADRAVRMHAVAALRQAGMTEEAEKLAGLEAITDKKSARIARDIIYIVYNTVNAASSYTAANAAVYIVNAADTTDATTRANTHAAAYAAYTAVHNISNAVNAAYIAVCAACVTCASGAAYAADATASAINGNDTLHIIELEFLNSELERRLFTLMDIDETEGLSR